MDSKFQTLPVVCDYMASLIKGKERICLEPTPGDGNLVRAVKAKGHIVAVPKDDYWQMDHGAVKYYDYGIMNPPFTPMKQGALFLEDVMQRCDHVIALMPWFYFINSDKRLSKMQDHGLKAVTSLPRKAFANSRIQTMIIELEIGYKGPTILKTFSW